jgi:hypothetical protein
MTSSAARKPKARRRLSWLAAILVVLAGIYSAGWFYAAGWLTGLVDEQLAVFNKTGRSADCMKPAARGFPLGFGLSCDSLRFEDPETQLALSTAGLDAGVQVYDPMKIEARLASPARFSAPGAGSLVLDWRELRAGVRLAPDFPKTLDAAIDKLTAAGGQGGAGGLLKADHGEAHIRQEGADLVLTAGVAGAAFDPALTNGAVLPPLAADVDLTIKEGVAWARAGAKSLRGQSGRIRTLALSTGETTGLDVAGAFSVGADGLVDADLTVTVRDPKALGEQLAKAFPKNADQFRAAMAGLAAMGNNASLPLKISRGEARLGFLPVGKIPPLR